MPRFLGNWEFNTQLFYAGKIPRFIVSLLACLKAVIGQSGSLANDANASKVLWNFYEATTVNLQREWYGSILALNATVNTNSNLTGTLAAKSYVGNAEIHDGYWSYTPPVTQVPEPSTLLLTLLGFGFIALVRIRHQR